VSRRADHRFTHRRARFSGQTAVSSDYQYTLDRPYRPVGVKLFNAIGGVVQSLGLQREISVDRILRAAEWATGLHDFGDDDFLEPLNLLADQYEHQARLHSFGHYIVRKTLQTNAQNRLLLQDAWKRHPEAVKQELHKPLYVVGMPRTGTTLLYNLLCQDPNARPLMVWETLYPAPSPREERRATNRPRQRKARFMVNAMNALAPNLKQVHAIEPDNPEEDGWLLNNTFVSLMFLLNGEMPGYLEYYRGLSHERLMKVYDYYHRSLKLLQGNDTHRHWVLKSPVHQGTLGELLEAVPTASVVYTHRDPIKVIPSLCSLVCMTRGILSDHIDPKRSGPELTSRMTHAIERAEQAEEKYSDRIMDVLFDTVVKDPIGTVKQLYERFGYQYSPEMEAGMQRWLAENPQGKHGTHKYELEQFGLTEELVNRHFGEYWNRVQKRRSAA